MKIAIVANGYLTRGLAPFNKPEWITWGLSRREYEWQREYPARGFDVLFECHDYDWDDDYISFMSKNHVLHPNRTRCKELAQSEGFKSSIAWMLAEAILRGPDEIAVYGFDACVISKEEYWGQIPNIKYFMGLAVGKGIKVYVPEMCSLYETSMYGERKIKLKPGEVVEVFETIDQK